MHLESDMDPVLASANMRNSMERQNSVDLHSVSYYSVIYSYSVYLHLMFCVKFCLVNFRHVIIMQIFFLN